MNISQMFDTAPAVPVSSSTSLMRLDWSKQFVDITPSAREMKEHTLAISRQVLEVNDAASQEIAVRAQREVSGFISIVEKARKATKEPALEMGRKIDEAAKVFIAESKAEELRLATLVGDFQALEAAKVRAAEQARLADERRIIEERQRAEMEALRAADAERRRLADAEAENARLAASAKSKRAKEILAQQQVEIERQRALAEARSHEELDRINEEASNAQAALAEQPKYEPVRAQGQRVQEDYEIIVSDIWLLAKAHPTCVRIEALVSEIKTLIKAGVKVAGVIAKPIVKAGVTHGRTVGAIDV